MKKNFYELGECSKSPYEVSERCNECAENTENNGGAYGCEFCWKDPDVKACGAYCGDECPLDVDDAFENQAA